MSKLVAVDAAAEVRVDVIIAVVAAFSPAFSPSLKPKIAQCTSEDSPCSNAFGSSYHVKAFSCFFLDVFRHSSLRYGFDSRVHDRDLIPSQRGLVSRTFTANGVGMKELKQQCSKRCFLFFLLFWRLVPGVPSL